MKRIVGIFMILSLSLVAAAFAADNGTPAEAEAMVKKAVAYIKTNGKDKAIAEFNNPKGQFIDRDLYIVAYDMNGKCLAQGRSPKMVGQDMIDLTDADGKFHIRERIKIAKEKGKGWQDYRTQHPLTKKIESKTTYIEKVGDIIVGCGAYK